MARPNKQEAGANLIILPGKAGQPPSFAQRYPTVFEAIEHVMEVLPVAQRGSAVIQTSTKLLFFAEIEAVFENARMRSHPSLQSHHGRGSAVAGKTAFRAPRSKNRG